MSIKSITRQPCSKCQADTLHKVSVCTVCGTIAPSPSEMRQAAWRRIHAGKARSFGRTVGSNYGSIRQAEMQWMKRKHDIAIGRLEEFQMVKRPRSINSERRPKEKE